MLIVVLSKLLKRKWAILLARVIIWSENEMDNVVLITCVYAKMKLRAIPEILAYSHLSHVEIC